MVEGILFGLVAATMQSLCYVYSRVFVTRSGNNSRLLFGLSHTWMGLMGLALLPFCWSTATLTALPSYLGPLVASIVFYVLGQVCLFRAIKWTDASRISPLLGLKVLTVTVITVIFLRQSVTTLQWVAVLMCVAAAFVLNYSGGRIPWPSMAAILGACVAYSLSDLAIFSLTRAMAPKGELRGRLLACCLCYIPLAPLGLALIAAAGPERRTWNNWKAALPVAVTWFLAMVTFFISISALGVVFANIVQSMRGPISIAIGLMVVRLGHLHVESKVALRVLLRRVAAALLMCAAVGVFTREQARMSVAETHKPAPHHEVGEETP